VTVKRTRPSLPSGCVVVGYDGTASARLALATTGPLLAGRRVVVVHVWSGAHTPRVHTTHVDQERDELVDEVRVAARREAESVAEEGARLARDAQLDALPLLIEATGSVAAELVRVADEASAVAIVVGRGRTTRLGLRHGDGVVSALIGHTRLPVVLG